MTDNEIKKALECCFDKPFANCSECPLGKCDICLKKLPKFALDLINRQQAEIEKLIEFLDDKCDRCIEKERTEAIKEFADNLCRVFAGHSDYHGDTILTKIICSKEGKPIQPAKPIDTSKIKAEAIKEFAEKLKIYVVPQKADGYTREVIPKSSIDNLVKEMVGENK